MTGKIDIQVISIFPEMFDALTDYGVVGKAIDKQIFSLKIINPRDFADDKHRTVDDRPYGGGPGMVMMAEPLVKAIKAARQNALDAGKKPLVVYLSPQGRVFEHSAAQLFAEVDSLILLAGRYEGIDQRVIDQYIDQQWSIGDYVLSGGELAAMVMIDAITRLLPNSLGNGESALQDSFVQGLLDFPHYTRPEVFAGEAVPEVLLQGNHQQIARWREKQSLGMTYLYRPDLLEKIELTDRQQQLLDEFNQELKN